MRIEIRGLTKVIDGKKILNDVNMELQSGKIYGFVGRNGSGKTMLMRHILGFIYATSGEISIDGRVMGRDTTGPGEVGAIIENPGFIGDISGYKNLKILASIRGKVGKKEILETMDLVGLNPNEKKHVSRYSLGMRQRLGFAQALMEDPPLLILDEPMNGLDNNGVEKFREVLLQKKEEEKLIIVASHNSEDIKTLCDETFFFEHGVVEKKE